MMDKSKKNQIRHRRAKEIVIFDADRDNNGKGIPSEKMIRMLKKIIAEDKKGNV